MFVKTVIHECIIGVGTAGCVNFIVVVIYNYFDHLMISLEPHKVKAKAQYTDKIKSTKYRRVKQVENKRENDILIKIPRLESFFGRSEHIGRGQSSSRLRLTNTNTRSNTTGHTRASLLPPVPPLPQYHNHLEHNRSRPVAPRYFVLDFNTGVSQNP